MNLYIFYKHMYTCKYNREKAATTYIHDTKLMTEQDS